MSGTQIALVAARAKNGTIGKSGVLPWRMKDDLAWFKKVTLGKPVVMGRKTYESIGKPLPGRTNIVVTRQGDFEAEGVIVVHGLERALRIAEIDAEKNGSGEVCIIGGGEIYAESLARAHRIYLTTLESDVEGDTEFPELDRDEWVSVSVGRIEKGDGNEHDALLEVWQRRNAPPPQFAPPIR
ncbi:MAG: dihydrofolate reductase [Parvularcula sp.]|jgi:dihydrofolate reductase|nr:dihydrofolate reductase [Parvularcula sp.]